MTIRCLLWDFGDTLYDELSLWSESKTWMEVYRSFGERGGLGERWSAGKLDEDEAISEIASRFHLPSADVRAHLRRTDLFVAHPFTHSFYQSQQLPQAIVTINPASFRVMATSLGLHEHVETIVISGEEKTLDKRRLCRLALDRMTGTYARNEALLIDNSPTHVEAWRNVGGRAYHFRGDEPFRSDVAGGLDTMVERS